MPYRRLNRPTGWVGLSRCDLCLHWRAKVLSQDRLLIARPDRLRCIGRPAQLRPIQRTPDAATAPVQYVGVDHGRTHIVVAE